MKFGTLPLWLFPFQDVPLHFLAATETLNSSFWFFKVVRCQMSIPDTVLIVAYPQAQAIKLGNSPSVSSPFPLFKQQQLSSFCQLLLFLSSAFNGCFQYFVQNLIWGRMICQVSLCYYWNWKLCKFLNEFSCQINEKRMTYSIKMLGKLVNSLEKISSSLFYIIYPKNSRCKVWQTSLSTQYPFPPF